MKRIERSYWNFESILSIIPPGQLCIYMGEVSWSQALDSLLDPKVLFPIQSHILHVLRGVAKEEIVGKLMNMMKVVNCSLR